MTIIIRYLVLFSRKSIMRLVPSLPFVPILGMSVLSERKMAENQSPVV